MKKVLFFLAFLLFLIASCSSRGHESDNDNEPGEIASISSSSTDETSGSSSSTTLNSSAGATSSSSAGTTQSSSVGTTSSSSAGTTQSSSSRATSSSSAGTTAGSSSSSKQNNTAGDLVCVTPISTTATDYSNSKNWSVYTENPTKEVDIFLLYPTAIQSSAAEDCPYANINNSSMRSSVDSWYRGLGKVATEHVNPYLPYYRQANVFGSGCSGANMTGGAAMEDVIASFQYYLEHINKGKRPFIMLGFSQGSSPLWELAENRLEKICGAEFGAANRKNHIVTYATGIPGRSTISASKPVKFSTSYNDINVITAWNPYWESDTSCASNQLGVRAMSGPTTNPITWTIDEDYHAMTENPLLNQNTILGARSYNKLGILLVKRKTEPSTPPGCGSNGSMYMGQHGQDISYFSASIIQNMKDRIEAWNAKYK
jgi:hypothetical protein